MNTKKIIAIEGLDGVGKSTQVKKLSKALTKLGHSNKVYKFPNKEDAIYELIEECLKKKEQSIELARLYCNNRTRTVYFGTPEDILIFDRSIFSTMQYQFANISNLGEFYYNCKDILDYESDFIPKANLTIYLDLPLGQIIKRIEIRGNADVIESDKEFLYKVNENLKRMDDYPNLVIINCDGLDEERVHKEILKVVKEKILGTEL